VLPESDSESEDEGVSSAVGGAISSLFGWGGADSDSDTPPARPREDRPFVGCMSLDLNPTRLDPAYILFRRFLESPDDGSFKERLKVISRIDNLDDCDFNMMLRPLARRYNGLPYQIRECGVFHASAAAQSISIDVHLFTYLSKLGLAACRDILPSIVFDLCLMIQGELEDELPERLLIACRVNNMQLDAAVDVTHQFD
jgi:hypothetical protein